MRYIIIINTFWTGWNGFRFTDDIFNAFSWMKFALIIISLKFVPRRPVSILTHWGRDKMDAISQTTLSNTFLRMKMLELWLKFVPEGPINNIPALVQIMAWRHPGDKPLSEPMLVRLLTHICVTRPQWVKLCICSDNDRAGDKPLPLSDRNKSPPPPNLPLLCYWHIYAKPFPGLD